MEADETEVQIGYNSKNFEKVCHHFPESMRQGKSFFLSQKVNAPVNRCVFPCFQFGPAKHVPFFYCVSYTVACERENYSNNRASLSSIFALEKGELV